MADKITYYAIVDDLSSREQPAGVLRRIYFEAGGRRDEAFSQDLVWERTAMLVSAERGDLKTISSRSLRKKQARSWHGSGPT